MKLTYSGNTLKYYKKDKNGDSFLLKKSDDEKMIVGIVADGISQLPCDWKASELACEVFYNSLIESEVSDIKERIEESLNEANRAFFNVEDDYKGLGTTLSAVICRGENECYITSIGDSRIYLIREGELKLLTTDDAIRDTKTIMTNIGRRVVEVSKLTEHLGRETVNFQTSRVDLIPGDILLCATDGFYEARRSSFERDLLKLSESKNLEGTFNEIFEEYGWSAKDDMTALVIGCSLISS